jgi:predicted Ser/Thr protein kinase
VVRARQPTFVRRLLGPTTVATPSGAGRVRLLALVRGLAALTALAGNVVVFAILLGAGVGRPDVIWAAAAVNVGLLGLDAIITLGWLRRRGRGYRPLLYACVAMEVVAGIVWLQLTGTVSSYYLAAGLLIIPLYRLGVGYDVGLLFGAGTLALHVGAFALEELGALQPASLFETAPSGIYASTAFRWAAMSSISWCYLIAFATGNFVASMLLERDRAVDDANRARLRAEQGAQHGRLSGAVVAGRYEIGEILGRGGMGEVYQAHRRDDGRTVAVKVLHAHMEHSTEIRERFKREAALAARLPSAHVAELYEYGTTDEGYQFLAMELLRGEDLGAVLRRRNRVPPDELLPIVDDVAAALEAAHGAGIVHRDLKPQNIFLVPREGGGTHAKLVDFGIARLLEDAGHGMTQSAAVLGTAGYMAPEQARGSLGEIGPHTDVFAFGAIIYRALAGRSAFTARSTAAAVDEVLNFYPPPPSRYLASLPRDVDLVVGLALAKPPADRYARASELARDLHLALRGELPAATRDRAARLPQPSPDDSDSTVAATPA